MRGFGAVLLLALIAVGGALVGFGAEPLHQLGVLDRPTAPARAGPSEPTPARSDAATDPSAVTNRTPISTDEADALTADFAAALQTARQDAAALRQDAEALREERDAARRQIQRAQTAAQQSDAARLAAEEALQTAIARLEGASEAFEPATPIVAPPPPADPVAPRLTPGLDPLADPTLLAAPLDVALAAVNAAPCGRARGGGMTDPAIFSIVGGRQAPYRSYLDGGPAPAGAFPWIASLKIVQRLGDQFGAGEISSRCGASVIDRQWILTAAHCLTPEPFHYVEVTLGATNLGDPRALRLRADQAICHIAYDHKYLSLSNDIALIRLPEPLPDAIPAARLATPSFVYDLSRADRPVAAGWGATVTDAWGAPNLASQQLKLVELGLQDAHGSHLYVADPDGAIEGVCVGDSGGPLSIGSGEDATLIGVASHVVAEGNRVCATPEFLSVFTNVALYGDWIENVAALCAARGDC